MKNVNLKGVKPDVWARLVVLLLAFISQFLVILGKRTQTIDIDKWQEYAAYFSSAITAVWGFWKNNSFTKAAQYGDKVKEIAKENGNYDYDDSSQFDDLKIEESEVDLNVDN